MTSDPNKQLFSEVIDVIINAVRLDRHDIAALNVSYLALLLSQRRVRYMRFMPRAINAILRTQSHVTGATLFTGKIKLLIFHSADFTYRVDDVDIIPEDFKALDDLYRWVNISTLFPDFRYEMGQIELDYFTYLNPS